MRSLEFVWEFGRRELNAGKTLKSNVIPAKPPRALAKPIRNPSGLMRRSVSVPHLICGFGGEDIVCSQGTTNALEGKLAYRLNCDGILNGHQHAGANEDLAGLGFVACSSNKPL